MKTKFKYLLIFIFLALLVTTSCQDEQSDLENPNNEETLEPNSALVNLMRNTTANFGAYDDVLDNASCFSIELPVTIVISDITITIEAESDLEELEELLSSFNVEDDAPEFLFPITIIFSDYSEITIENEEQLESFINQCDDEDEVIECVDFQYPISFSVFNSEFDIIDTVIVENDEALHNFLEELEDDDNALIVSLNFPVTLEFANGENVEVNSNQELANAIASAQNDCDEEDEECTEEFVSGLLVQCPWDFSNGTDAYDNYKLVFNEDGSLEIPEGMATSAIGGAWSLSSTNNGLILTFSELTAFQEDLGGEWLIVGCSDDQIEIVRGDMTIELEKDCEGDTDCSVVEVNENLQDCLWEIAAYSSFPEFQGIDLSFNSDNTFSISQSGNTYNFVSYWSLSVVGEYSYLVLDSDFEDLGGDWKIVECDDERYEFVKDNQIMVLEKDCESQEQVFDCFTDFELVECANDAGEAEFNLSADTIGLITCTEPYTASFHFNLSDAENNVFPIENTESYFSITYEIYLRVEAESGNYQIFSIFLNAIECNLFECFESFDAVIELCDENNDSTETFDLTTAFANCTPSADEVTYHINQEDAVTGVNPIPNPQAFNNTHMPQTMYVRVEIEGQFEVFPIELLLTDCNAGNCTEGDIDGILLECMWNITSFNGSNDLVQWNFDFEGANNIVVIYTDTQTIDATWTTSQTSDGVLIEFSNVSGPNIQAIAGAWLVVECTGSQLVLHDVSNSDNELVFDRNCE